MVKNYEVYRKPSYSNVFHTRDLFSATRRQARSYTSRHPAKGVRSIQKAPVNVVSPFTYSCVQSRSDAEPGLGCDKEN